MNQPDRSPAQREASDPGPQPAATGEGHALGQRIAAELARHAGEHAQDRTSWRHGELAARIRDADRETELEAGS